MFVTQIRTRIILYFVAIAAFVSLLFSAFAFLFSYHIEDSFFKQLLNDEAVLISTQISGNQAPNPHLPFIEYHPSMQTLPRDVLRVLKEEPERIEFGGADGSHYHLKAFEHGYLLAEVSQQLIVRKIKGGMASIYLVIFVIISLLVCLMAWSLAKRLLRPMDQLVRIMSDVKAGELPVGFSQNFAPDEIGLFAKQLDNAMARIRQFIQREQDFTRDVSHELRTPVAISRGALTLLNEEALSAEQQVLVKRIATANKQMQQCIEGLLALAREGEFAQQQVKLLPLVESVIVENHEVLNDKPITFDIDIEANAEIATNADALKIILINLIANAFHHTEQGRVLVRYQDNTLTVKDAGKGISPEIMPQVFDTGVKGRKSQGLGIGLSLVKRLAGKLHITLEVSSSEYGTEFTLRF